MTQPRLRPVDDGTDARFRELCVLLRRAHHVATNAGTITYSGGVLAPLIVADVLGLAGWGWWLHAGHAEQEHHLTKHDSEIATLQRDSNRILTKLDQILRELRSRR